MELLKAIAGLQRITPLHRLTRLLSETPLELQHLLTLINHLAVNFPLIILASVDEYYTALAKLCQSQHNQEWLEAILTSLSVPLNAGAESGM
jgi:ubiquitin-protein ligase E3 C